METPKLADKEVPVGSIKIAKNRQRQGILPQLEELAISIRSIGLLHPIVITKDNRLVAGQRRLAAVKLLKWKTIPCRLVENMSDLDTKTIELEENVKRVDLSWVQRTLAIAEFHELKMKNDKTWTTQKTGSALNTDHTLISKWLQLADPIRNRDEIVSKATSFDSAYNAVKRRKSREHDDAINKIEVAIGTDDLGELTISAPEAKELEKAKAGAPFEIIVDDFIGYADAGEVERCNFLHCDFPYGLQHGKSAQGQAATLGGYEDSPELYWELLRCLARNLDTILYRSAHVIFWLSMNNYTETVEFFQEETDLVLVQPHPLIWHKTDNKGIVADVTRRPRHIYETALFLSRGDRKIVQPVADCYGSPTLKADATHLSEKSEAMLRHFFRMVCDDLTEMLDPTCGGGSALRAALSLGAKHAVGIETVEEYAKLAEHKTKTAWALDKYSKRKKNADG